MKGYNVEVNGRTYRVEQLTPMRDGKTRLKITPLWSPGNRAAQNGFPPPQSGELSFEDYMKLVKGNIEYCRKIGDMNGVRHETMHLKNLQDMKKNGCFSNRCSTKKNNPGKPKPEDAAVVSRLKLRHYSSPSLKPLQRLRQSRPRAKKLRALPPSKEAHDTRSAQIRMQVERRLKQEAPPMKPEQGEDFESFLKRCIDAGNDPEKCRRLWKEKYPEGQGEQRQETASFDKVEPEAIETDWRRRVQLERMRD